MPKTRDDLKTSVLEELLVLGAGEVASQEDLDVVERRIDPVLADLQARGKCYVATTDEIEDQLFNHLVAIVAEYCAPAFAGRPTNRALVADSEATLRLITRGNRGDPNFRMRFDPMLRRGAR